MSQPTNELPEVKCYYCRETIRLTRQSPKLVTADHICMSEAAKAKRFPQLDAELQKLRAKVDELARRRERIDQMMETLVEFEQKKP